MTTMNGSTVRSVHAVGSGAALALAAAVYVLGIGPWLARAGELEKERAALTAALEQAERQRASLAASANAIAGARRKLESSRVQLRPLATLNQQIARLTELAAACGLRIGQVTPGQAAVGTRAAAVPITLGGVGGYGQLVGLLERLRDEHPDVIVNGYRLAAVPAAGTENGPREAQFTLDLSWFSAPDAQASAAVPRPAARP